MSRWHWQLLVQRVQVSWLSALTRSNPGHFPAEVHGMTLQIFASVQLKMRFHNGLQLAAAYLKWLWIRIYTPTAPSPRLSMVIIQPQAALLCQQASTRQANHLGWEHSPTKDLPPTSLPGGSRPPHGCSIAAGTRARLLEQTDCCRRDGRTDDAATFVGNTVSNQF